MQLNTILIGLLITEIRRTVIRVNGIWRKSQTMITEEQWKEILENAQPMVVKKIVNNSPNLPKVKFKDDDTDYVNKPTEE